MSKITDEVHTANNINIYAKGTEKHSELSHRRMVIVWRNVLMFLVLHIAAFYGAYLFLMESKWLTCVFAYLLYVATATSVTAGAHRLWSHKAYKAKLPLRIILLVFYTMAFQAVQLKQSKCSMLQNSVIEWVRDHRMHHKFCDSDADPHNSERGFFFSHMGWLMVRKHPDIKTKGYSVNMSDLWNDPLLVFQHKNYRMLVMLFCFAIPTYIPSVWGEQAWNAFFVCVFFRYIFTLHVTWLVNSAAHMWGTKPYEKHIRPVETKIVSLLAVGEGFHNYHHTFPWDYRTAELGGYSLNFTKLFIDFMANIGWAYDLKIVTDELIESRVKRTGDGTHPVWGWLDPDLPEEEKTGSKTNF